MNFATLNKKWFHEVNISVTIPSPTQGAHARSTDESGSEPTCRETTTPHNDGNHDDEDDDTTRRRRRRRQRRTTHHARTNARSHARSHATTYLRVTVRVTLAHTISSSTACVDTRGERTRVNAHTDTRLACRERNRAHLRKFRRMDERIRARELSRYARVQRKKHARV